MGAALAGASAPYLARLIKQATGGNAALNIMAHAVLAAAVAKAQGNPALSGAVGAATAELIARQLYLDTPIAGLSEKQKETVSALSSLAAGLAGGGLAGAVSGAQAGSNAVQNNYLSLRQNAQKDKEIAECQSTACKAGKTAKWIAISLGQDGSMAAGVPAGLYDTVIGLVKAGISPLETYEAFKSLFNSGDALGNVSTAVKQSYLERIDRLEAEYQKAGASGSFKAGVESGKLFSDIAGLLSGAGGLAKGGALLVEKLSVKVAGKAQSAALNASKATSGPKAIPESSYPTLARPSPNAPSNVILGELGSLGRPTGVTAVLRESSLGGGSSTNPAIRPPGFEGQPANHARGHLLANSLGGVGDDARNLVTLFQRNANHPNMSSFERQVRGAVQSGETVSYRAIPIYTDANPMPTGVTLSARGSGGFTLDVSIPNISGVK